MNRRAFLLLGACATLGVVVGCDSVVEALPGGEFPRGPLEAPDSTTLDPVSHMLNRTTFGARPGDWQRVRALAPDPHEAAQRFAAAQLDPGSVRDLPGFWARSRFDHLEEPLGEHYEYNEKRLLAELVGATVARAAASERQLFEVMVQFWSDHFNIDPTKEDCRWTKAADDRDTIRAHALGDFGDMLRASALSPAMLWYLDGQANRAAAPADKPNENYARELLELHTLGVDGGYTQRDVMEAARCLTGWTAHPLKPFKTGKVEFVPALHDDGEKVVLGRRIEARGGPGDLDQLLDIVKNHPSTARNIARKLCVRFVADEPSGALVAEVAREFLRTAGSIRATLAALLGHQEFLSSRSCKFKLPFHFVVSSLRATGARTDGGEGLVRFLQRMGHTPFHYGTPDGYPQEPHPWLGTMLWRWNFAAALAEDRIKGTRARTDAVAALHGGAEHALGHLFGRRATPDEARAILGSGRPLALALSAPAFQRF
ncbi:MAG: DUF1800 domain-containing protein [Candidatus Sumerlaeia bacterium]|nr:DUF1800 domain-containing protein [Candidatus Sumerlaeia bacterium]